MKLIKSALRAFITLSLLGVIPFLLVEDALAKDAKISGTYNGYVTTSNGAAILTFEQDGSFFLNSSVAPNLLYRMVCQGTWDTIEGTGNTSVHFVCYRPQQAAATSNACGSTLGSLCIAVVKGTATIDGNVMTGKWFTVAIDPATQAELAPRNLNVPFVANKVTIDDFNTLPYPTLP